MSHPSDTPHSSHVESRSRKALRKMCIRDSVCAVLQYEKVPVLRRIVGAYIQLSRNTPLLVQLFFLYYGLPKIGIKTNAELCGIAGLAFLGGSYMAEAFRSGLEAIEPCLLYTSRCV